MLPLKLSFLRYCSTSRLPAQAWRVSRQLRACQTSATVAIPFAHSRRGSFVQAEPELGNQFTEDVTMQAFLRRHVKNQSELEDIEADLTRFGDMVSVVLPSIAAVAHANPPSLEQFDAWGQRIDHVSTSWAWQYMHRVSAEEGLVAIAYDDQRGKFRRLHQACKLWLFSPSSALYSCPLAMTDGAAKILTSMAESSASSTALPHLLSRDPDQFWTSGQWMTEKRGGSDVAAGTETIAVQDGNRHRLYGYKWFTSAVDAQMALTLARSVDGNGHPVAGKHGLSLYYVEIWNDRKALNGIEVQRLKDKLGTRSLPTAELLLDGAVAEKLSEDGGGISAIAPMLTITRLHNSLSAVANMRRLLFLSRDYSTKRRAFGKLLRDLPLHMQTLARMEVTVRGNSLLLLETARLLGLEETGDATEDERLRLRIMVPLCKLFTAKQAMGIISEGLESFGGQGYMEDTGLPVFLRDAQVLPIWEGTTNIMSLDVLRAILSTKGHAAQALFRGINEVISGPASQLDQLAPVCERLSNHLELVSALLGRLADEKSQTSVQLMSRDLSMSLAQLLTGSLLVDHAAWTKKDTDMACAIRWGQCDPWTLGGSLKGSTYTSRDVVEDQQLVFDGRP